MLAALVALCFLVFAVIAIPLFLIIIYKFFYDSHVNKSLQSEGKVKRWISPMSLFFLLVLLEFFICIMLSVLYKADHRSETGSYEESGFVYHVLTPDEIDRTLLASLKDGEGTGYEMEDRSKGDFTCKLYSNTEGALLPSYVICLTYTGKEEMNCFDMEVTADSTGSGFLGEFEAGDDKTLYIVISSGAVYNDHLSFRCNLYPESMDSYSTNNLGTYDMPESDTTFSVKTR